MSLELSRVAEVLVHVAGRSAPEWSSGYLVRDGYVLTAAHVLHGSIASIGLGFSMDQPGQWTPTAEVAWLNKDLDIAVLRITGLADRPPDALTAVPGVRFGVLEDPIVGCQAVGFPFFKVRDDPAHPLPDGSPSTYAEYEHAFGPAAPWSGGRSGTLGFSVIPPGPSPDPKRSPWEGMSGAAVFDKDGGGFLVGVIREHHPPEGAGRLTATAVAHWYANLPPDELAVLCELIGLPAERAMLARVTSRPPAGGPAAVPPEVVNAATRSYLAWVAKENSRLTVTALASSRGAMEIDLERVYVELKVDFSSQDEREAARINRWRERNGDLAAPDLSPDEDADFSWQLADGQPIADFLGDPGWSAARQADGDEVLTIGELYRRDDASVILGAPGSGKTTIARWLALLHAKTLHSGELVVRVPTATMDVSVRSGQFNLGPPLLPILVRMAKYADDRQHRPPGTRPRTLLEFLGYAWDESPPTWHEEDALPPYRVGMPIPPEILTEIFHAALYEHRALVVLDGLDEVPRNERVATADAVSDFINTWIRPARPGQPATKVIATSRIAGYKEAPLPADLTQVTIQPMTDTALAAFLRSRLTVVLAELAKQGWVSADPPDSGDATRTLLDLLGEQENGYVRGLATNPLLAGVIVSVFIDQKYTLPRQRVELYESAVTSLTDVWRNRLTRTYSPQIARDIFTALPAVAVYIHDTRPTGVIGAGEFRNRMVTEMSRLSPGTPDETRVDVVESLRKVMEEDLGLLVASGPEAFRFAHRSFQEYLAAQHLIADPALSASQILARLGDSQWREPILMAIGLMNWRHSDAMAVFTQALLAQDGPLPEFFPETALLLAAAIPQMADVPPAVVQQTARHLLASYSVLFREQRMPEVRKLLAAALGTLRGTAYAPDVDAVLAAALRQPPGDDPAAACATARLIRDIGAATPRLAAALMHAAARWDSSELGSPITEALGLLVSPRQLPEKGEAQQRLPAVSWGGTELVMRDTLRAEPALVETIRGNPSWLSLLVALYGGYWNLGAAADLNEYERLSGYLRLDELTRREFAVYYGSRYRGERYGDEDPVLAMVVARRAERKEATRRFATAPLFDHGSITRDSPLTTRIIEGLDSDEEGGLATLTRFLRASLVSGNGDPALRADALVALWALGHPVEAELADRPADPASVLAARRIAALIPGLADATVRAGRQAGPALAAAAGRLPAAAWEQLGAALTKILHHAGADPASLFTGRDRIPRGLLPRVLIEEVAQTVGGWGDRPQDGVERFTGEADEYALPLLLEALCSQGSAWSNGYRRYSYWWPADPLAFPPDGTDDIPVAALDQLAALPAGMTQFFGWLCGRMYGALLEDSPLSLNEVGLIMYARVRDRDEKSQLDGSHLDMLRAIDENLAGVAQRADLFYREACELADPWLSARALLRIAELFPAQRPAALLDAANAAAEVSSPARAFQLHERLALLGSIAERARHVAACRSLALSIEDPELAARALLRITRLVPAPEIDDLVSAAADRIRRLDWRASQLELLRLISEMFPDRPGCKTVISGLLRDIGASGHEEAHVTGHWGNVVAQHFPALCGNDEALVQALVPVVLYGQAVDLVRAAQQDEVTGGWQALRAHPSHDTVRRLLDAHPGQFIQCTGPVARSLDEAMADADAQCLEPILGRLVRVSHDAEPTVRTWLGHPLPRARQIAALLLAERYRITDNSAASVATLLLDKDDLLRSRARSCVVPGPSVVQMSVSTMGPSAVTTLAEFAHEHHEKAPGMTAVFGWHLGTLLHDDPDALSAWCDDVKRDGTPSAADWIVRGVCWASTPVWHLLLDRLRHGDPTLQTLILHAASSMLYRGTDGDGDFLATDGALRIDSARWAQLYDVLRSVDPEPLRGMRVLPIWIDDVFDTADKVLAATGYTLDGSSSLRASRMLRRASATSFGAILAAGDEAEVRQGLYRLGHSVAVPLDSGLAAFTIARNRRRQPDRVDGPWTGLLRAWASRLLRENASDLVSTTELEFVLEALASAARVEPESFRHDADMDDLSRLLAGAGLNHRAYRGRAAAARLLGLLRHGSPEVFRALQYMLHDSAVEVRQAALGAIVALRSVDRRLIKDLAEALLGQSVTVAWAAAQLLGVIGENARTPKPARDEIIDQLTAAVQAQKSRRTVHFAFADTAMPDMPELDDVFTETLRRVYRLG